MCVCVDIVDTLVSKRFDYVHEEELFCISVLFQNRLFNIRDKRETMIDHQRLVIITFFVLSALNTISGKCK